jgi:hypothetical protein
LDCSLQGCNWRCERAARYASDEQFSFEREFQNFLEPWTRQDLKLKCEDCGVESEEVEYHGFPSLEDKHWREVVPNETANLCADKCEASRSAKYEKSKTEESGNHQGNETTYPNIDFSELLRELKVGEEALSSK